MPTHDMGTADGRLAVLRRMLLIREFEAAVADRFADDEIPGFVHLSTGQEAVAAGAAAALEADDYVTSTHRGHGHCLAAPARQWAAISVVLSTFLIGLNCS